MNTECEYSAYHEIKVGSMKTSPCYVRIRMKAFFPLRSDWLDPNLPLPRFQFPMLGLNVSKFFAASLIIILFTLN